ncbi:MAG: hypothetical protein KAR47_00265, partial [Planctomycetes bacterium]|nr:hypothetical protein [Planctomycetota bacterium]
VIVDIDHDGGDGTEDLVRLFVDRIPVASHVITILDNDFVNGDQSGFGVTGGNATGGFQTTLERADFTSGKINYAAGLWYSSQITGIETSWCLAANLDGITPVNLHDIALLALNWLQVGRGLEGDIKKDGHVDTLDISVMAEYWLYDCE